MLFQNIMKLLQKYGMNFLNGLGTTLLLALISVAIGCVIGALVAIMRLSKSKVLRSIATVYTEVIRDTPLLLQLYFFYFLLPDILPALKLSKFACITVALVINSGAYMSEVFRSGIQSIDRGQTEAARSLGLSSRQTMMRIVLPQAFQKRASGHVQRVRRGDEGNVPGLHVLRRRPDDAVSDDLRQDVSGHRAADYHRHYLFCRDFHHEQADYRP